MKIKNNNNPSLFHLHFQEKLLKEQISVQLFFPLLIKKKKCQESHPTLLLGKVNHLLFLDQTQAFMPMKTFSNEWDLGLH